MPSAPPRHTPKRAKRRHHRTHEDVRPDATTRGYGAAWRKVRAAFLIALAIKQAWPFACCEHCLIKGKRVQATDVDHIKRKALGGTDEFENLQGLCHSCHSRKTATEMQPNYKTPGA